MMWANGKWPFSWSFFTNWRGFVLDIGRPKVKVHGETTPESQFVLDLSTRPFGMICFWHTKRLFWIGDKEWKRALTTSSTH